MAMKAAIRLFPVLLLMTFFNSVSSQDKNWTHFRGSQLDGIATGATNLPIFFNDTTHVIWKTDIPGRGWSSPVIYGEQVWLTTATPDGKELSAICLDFNSGKLIHDIRLFTPVDIIRKHSINSYATPTPAIEEGFVYLHFGSLGTACVRSSDGKVMWTRTDLKCNHVQGPGSSPLIYGNLLILHFEGVDVRFIIALDKTTGKEVWMTHRPEEPYLPLPDIGKKAYITPLIINVNGRDLLISNGSAVCTAYDPLSGEEVWHLVRGAESTVSMPVFENGLLYFYTGFMVNEEGGKFSELLAVNPDGKGDISSSHVIWRKEVEPMQLLTPLLKDGLIYTIDTRNVLMCLDAKTGEEYYTHRLKDKFNSSPVYANGKIYFSSIRGEVVVIEEGKELKILANNHLDGEIWATPAVIGNDLLIRTDKKLYKFGY
jgi:outer membrane protein assembly factor BamB